MRAAVFGAGGMLGVALVRELERRGAMVFPYPHTIIDIADGQAVFAALSESGPDIVFNAAGVLNTSTDGPAMVRANALGPHIIAREAAIMDASVIHVSTDCVFSGRERAPESFGYWIDAIPDPVDLYGRTKLAGEVRSPQVANVRTSFVGPDHGLWAWVVEQARAGATVEGWTKAMWSGSSVWAAASGLVDLIDTETGEILVYHGLNGPQQGGITHMGTEEPISKYDAILAIAHAEGLEDLVVLPTPYPEINRELHRTAPLPSLVDALAARP